MTVVEQEVKKISHNEVRKLLTRMKSGKAVSPNNKTVEFLTGLFNKNLKSEAMPEDWKKRVLVPIFKNKGDIKSCGNYKGTKLMNHNEVIGKERWKHPLAEVLCQRREPQMLYLLSRCFQRGTAKVRSS